APADSPHGGRRRQQGVAVRSGLTAIAVPTVPPARAVLDQHRLTQCLSALWREQPHRSYRPRPLAALSAMTLIGLDLDRSERVPTPPIASASRKKIASVFF